ncbi:MAG TPA: methyltransferase domain-containing protein [Pirellulaceae bacterium]|nr:methyltransferase domain-containing protein [Pirellulaceae bacterium]
MHRNLLLPIWPLRRLLVCFVIVAIAMGGRLAAQEAPENPAAPKSVRTPPALKAYKGRQIAQTMHYLGAEWLTRDNREQEERCSLMLANLGLKRGMAICDMGCGNGFYALQMAKMTGDDGHVYGVDIQPEMLKFLNERADEQGIRNVSPILGTFTDPRLPKGKIDLILLVDVYHEFSHPEQMLAAMREALSPTGACVLVEFRTEDPKVPIKPEHKMSKAQIMKEWPANGFKLVKEFDGLPWQHMMWFARDDQTAEK